MNAEVVWPAGVLMPCGCLRVDAVFDTASEAERWCQHRDTRRSRRRGVVHRYAPARPRTATCSVCGKAHDTIVGQLLARPDSPCLGHVL